LTPVRDRDATINEAIGNGAEMRRGRVAAPEASPERRQRMTARVQAWRWSWLGVPIALLVVIAALTVSLSALAQTDPSHPAHIHQGTCDELGDIVAPLDNVSEPEASEVSGTENPIPVRVSETLVELSLDDILAGEHSINIHESDDNIQEYIACGEIGGAVRGGKLVIGLGELNESSHTGVAVLEEAEGGTNVVVYLMDVAAADDADDAADDDADDAADDDADDAATDEATAEPAAAAPTTAPAAEPTTAPAAEPTEEPAAEAPAGNQVAVDIVNFAFNPSPLEISVGDTVTWTNQDGVPHTATGQDRAVLQSGTIPPGGSFSQTFTVAGEVPYFCEFHPNMNGVIIVQ
jgi:plastocyanin